MATKKSERAGACLDGMTDILSERRSGINFEIQPRDLIALRVLLDAAEAAVNGDDERREKKNAGDRARRAKKKSPRRKVSRRRTKPKPAAGGELDTVTT